MKSHPHPERPDRLRAIAASLARAGEYFDYFSVIPIGLTIAYIHSWTDLIFISFIIKPIAYIHSRTDLIFISFINNKKI